MAGVVADLVFARRRVSVRKEDHATVKRGDEAHFYTAKQGISEVREKDCCRERREEKKSSLQQQNKIIRTPFKSKFFLHFSKIK